MEISQANEHRSTKASRPADAHAAILKAAERIFAESGLAGARTEEIAKKAGVNKALLYYYFKSKDDLYRAVLEMYLGEFRSQAFAIFSSGKPAPDQILDYVTMHFDFISSRPYYPCLVQRLMTAAPESVERIVSEYSAPLYQSLVKIIGEGVQTGDLRPVDPHHTVYSLLGLIVFYFAAAPIVKSVSQVDPFDPENIKKRKEEVMSLIRRWLLKDVNMRPHDPENTGVDSDPRRGRKRRRILDTSEPQRGSGADRNREHG